jgi:hypothetical protein
MKTYKGHKFDNTVIEVLTKEHGKNVVKPFWESQGVEAVDEYRTSYDFSCNSGDYNICRYYGLKDGVFNNYSIHDLEGVKIITLPIDPEKQAFPYLAKCWDNDETDYYIAYVVGKVEVGNPIYPFVVSTEFKNVRKSLQIESMTKYDCNICIHAEPINETFESISAKHEQLKKRRNELQKELKDLEAQITYYSHLERILINE